VTVNVDVEEISAVEMKKWKWKVELKCRYTFGN